MATGLWGGTDMGWYGTATKFMLAAGVVLMSAGCSGRKEVAIAAKDDTIRKQEEMIKDEKENRAKLQDANDALAKQNEEMATRNAKIAQENAAQVAAMNAKIGDLESIMKGIDGKMVQVKPGEGVPEGKNSAWSMGKDGFIHITVASTVLFDSGRAELKTAAHPMLSDMCKTIKARFPGNYIRVEGHTDSTPVVRNKDKFADNMALSIARSRAVYDYMIKSGGMAASKMYTAGYGEFQPLVHPEKTAQDKAKNRRVEIVIMPDTIKIQKDQLSEAKPAAASSTVRRK
jgi:chemotaxis protein MotB